MQVLKIVKDFFLPKLPKVLLHISHGYLTFRLLTNEISGFLCPSGRKPSRQTTCPANLRLSRLETSNCHEFHRYFYKSYILCNSTWDRGPRFSLTRPTYTVCCPTFIVRSQRTNLRFSCVCCPESERSLAIGLGLGWLSVVGPVFLVPVGCGGDPVDFPDGRVVGAMFQCSCIGPDVIFPGIFSIDMERFFRKFQL